MKNHSLFLAALAALTLTSTPDTKAALTSNLVAYWDFEGQSDNNAAATGGGAYNGTLIGGATTTGTPRVGSGGLSLDGVDDYMNVPTIVPANGPWSVAAWFRADAAPTGAGRAFVYESTGGTNGFSMSFALRDGTTGAPVGTAAQTSLQVFSRYGGTNVNAQTLVDDTVIPAT